MIFSGKRINLLNLIQLKFVGIIFLTIAVSACVQKDGSVLLLPNALKNGSTLSLPNAPVKITKREIKAQQDKLRRINKAEDITEKADSVLIVEGKVIEKIFKDKLQAYKVKIDISKVVYGLKKNASVINIFTPTGGNGIEFKVGATYKVAAVLFQFPQQNHLYWTWSWMGTYEL